MKKLTVLLGILAYAGPGMASHDMDVAYKVAVAYVAGCNDAEFKSVEAENKIPDYANFSGGYEDEQGYVFNMSYAKKAYYLEVGIKNLDVRSGGCEQ